MKLPDKFIMASLLTIAGAALGLTAHAGTMNFDNGLITSDGQGSETLSNLVMSGHFEQADPSSNTYGQFSFFAENNPSLNLATDVGLGQCSINFFTFDTFGNNGTDSPTATIGFTDLGNYTGEITFYINNSGGRNAGTTPLMAIGSAGYSQGSGLGGVAIGSDWLSAGTFPMPNNSLIVEGNIGAGVQSPQYSVDVVGDVNFTGALRNNGDAVIQPDSAGNGGTTLMLRASDNGTPMYLHVNSQGNATWTTAP